MHWKSRVADGAGFDYGLTLCFKVKQKSEKMHYKLTVFLLNEWSIVRASSKLGAFLDQLRVHIKNFGFKPRLFSSNLQLW